MGGVTLPVLSEDLQIGKAAEHLVCADLILQGYSAFLSDAGLPYDVLVDNGTTIYRMQVRSTTKLFTRERSTGGVYRFGLRRAKRGSRRVPVPNIEFFAFVALDTRTIAYFPTVDLDKGSHVEGFLPMAMEFKSRHETYIKRGVTGKGPGHGRFLEDYTKFDPFASVALPNGKRDKWRPDVTEEAVRALAAQKLSVRQIALGLACSSQLVLSRAPDLPVQKHVVLQPALRDELRAAWRDGTSVHRLARRYGVARRTVRDVIREAHSVTVS